LGLIFLGNTSCCTAIPSDDTAADVRADDLNKLDHTEWMKALDSLGEIVTASTMSNPIKIGFVTLGSGFAAFSADDVPFQQVSLKNQFFIRHKLIRSNCHRITE